MSHKFASSLDILVANATGWSQFRALLADVDRMTGIKVATFRLRRPRINLNNDIDNSKH